MIEANDQSSASSFISPDGRFPSLFLGSLAPKFREYQNGTSLPSHSRSKLTSSESEYKASLQSSQQNIYRSISILDLVSRSTLDV
jgi:hypothetical protein